MTDEVRSLDLTGTTAPALSTTSDMPKVDAPKADPPKGAVSDAELKAGETPPKDDKPADDKPADDKPTETEGEPKKEAKADKKDETPAWQKREITIARNRQRAAEERAVALEGRLDKLLTVMETQSTKKVETTEADPRPVRTAYDDPEKYEADLVAWSAKTAAKVTQAEIEKTQRETAAKEKAEKEESSRAETQRVRADAWNKSKTAALEKYPDYIEVAEADDVKITPAMAFAIMEENLDSGQGTEIAYHLGTHKEEAAKIAALPTIERQQLAIGRLAERLATKVVKPTKAPDPPKPIGSKSRAGQTPRSEMPMEEYADTHPSRQHLRPNPH